jgi:hypothetical protein
MGQRVAVMANNEHGVVGANDQRRRTQEMELAILVVQNGGTRRTGQDELAGTTRDVLVEESEEMSSVIGG